jgi:ABC-type sulfate/molybdate transport systems ATPase subunit
MKPRLLLLDEPFSALDGGVKKELLDEVNEHVAKAKVPAILVTHDTTEARALGERVLFIEKGRVARSASIDDAALTARG